MQIEEMIGGNVTTIDADLPPASYVPEMVISRPWTTEDVAQYLGVNKMTVLRHIKAGDIPAKKLGGQFYFDPVQVARAIGMSVRPFM